MISTRLSLISLILGLTAAPCSSTAAPVNLVENPGFESFSFFTQAPLNWNTYNGGTLSSSTSNPYSENRAGRSRNRTNTNQGLRQSLLNAGWTAGKSYAVSAWVRTNVTTPSTVIMGVRKIENSITQTTQIQSLQVTNTWKEISGIYDLSVNGSATGLDLYFNGPASGVELFVDDVSFVEVNTAIENLLRNPGFEGGTAGWSPRGSATVMSSSGAHSGSGAALVTNRTAASHGIEQSVFGKTEGGRMYYAAGWVMTDVATPNPVNLTVQVIDGGVSSFLRIASGEASSTQWTWLSGYVTLPESSSGLTDVRFSVEGPAGGVGMTVDNCYFAPVTGLRRAASAYPGLRLGTGGVLLEDFNNSPKYEAALSAHYHLSSPGNSLKFKPTEPTKGNWQFAESNAIIDFGLAHGGSSRGHAYVWHKNVPDFAANETVPSTLQKHLWDHIDYKGAYFRGRLPWWDVVNEAIAEDGNGLRSTLWYDTPGIGYAAEGDRYIREAFIRARAAHPEAVLVYNDYATDPVNTKSNTVYAMLQGFVNDGVPVDAIGFQAHLNGPFPPNLSSVRTNYQRFQDLGLDLQVTELDYRLPVDANGIATPQDLIAQGDRYFDFTSAVVGFSRLKLFQTWGIFDGSSWIPGNNPGAGQALPLDFNYNRKPAYWGLWNAFAGQCEKLPLVQVSAGDTQEIVSENMLLGGNAGRRLNANGPSDFITLRAHVPFTGTWAVNVGALRLATGGRFQLSVAAPGSNTFTNVGSVQDTYAASQAATVQAIENYDFQATGDWQFRFTVSGKNAAATDHDLSLDYIRLTPVSCAPAISALPNRSIKVNSTLPPVLFLAEDDFAQGTLVVTATSSNPALLPSSALVVSGESPYYTIAANPLANQSGSTLITLTASDGTLSTSRSFTLNVGDNAATVTLGNLAATYTGEPIDASATTVPPGLAVDFTYNGSTTAPTDAGTYEVVATVNDAVFEGTATGMLVIGKATATVILGDLAATYSGSPKAATATTVPPGLAVGFTYEGSATAPTAAGSYMVAGTINDANYQGAATGQLLIDKAPAAVTLGNLAATYDGSAKAATVATVPSGLTVNLTYNGSATAPTAAGNYMVVATVNDANYQGSVNGQLVIAKAPAAVTLGNLAAAYDGSPKAASATTVPLNLAVDFTYDGSATAPTAAGRYAVMATVNNANYQGTASGTLVISLLSARERYFDWQFNEISGTQLNSTVNTGTRSIVNNGLTPPKPTWNSGGPMTHNGVINIGDTPDQKWNPNSAANGGPTGATGQIFRSADFTAPLTSGNIVFEFRVANWNLGGTDGIGGGSNGIGFRVGETVGSVFNAVNLEFDVTTNTSDIRVLSSTVGSATYGLVGTGPASTVAVNAPALTAGKLYRISTAGTTDWTLVGAANNNVGTTFTATAAGAGTGSAIELTIFPQNQLGAVNLVGSPENAVTVRLLANLDTGVWSSQAMVGTSGVWLPVTTDGTGLTKINRIQLMVDARTGAGWQYGGVQGTAGEFVQIDSVTLSAPVSPAVDFVNTQLTAGLSQGQIDLPFSLNTPKLPSSATYTGQPVYGALKLQPVGSLATNGASLSFANTGGMKVEWNGPQGGSEAGRYAENDVATGVFVVRRQEFLNGLSTQRVGFNSENDTLAANVVLQHKHGRVKSGRFRWVVKDSGDFYISEQIGPELLPAETPDNSPVVLSSEALSLTWNSYNPWDLNSLNPPGFTPVTTPAFTNIQAIGVWLSATAGANPGGTNQFQGLQVTSLASLAFGGAAAVMDTTPPVIALIGTPTVTVAVGAPYADAGASATDAVDGTVDLTTTNPVNTAIPAVYTITYNANDTSGNAATPVTRTVTVAPPGFSGWITGTFAGGATVPPGQQGPNDDPDNDSVSNLMEYAIAGQDPTLPNPTIGNFAGDFLSFTKRADTGGLTYTIERSTDLGIADAWTPVTGTPPDYLNDANTISYKLTQGNQAQNFLRLRVSSN